MAQTVFFLRTACRHLMRGGQRSLVAFLCIAFGVMSLVAMTVLAHSIARTMILDSSEMIGADLSIERMADTDNLEDHISSLEALRREGVLSEYTLVSLNNSLAFRRPGSGSLRFISTALGIDPLAYPLAGRLEVGSPANTGLATLLHAPGDLVITADLALENALSPGDPLLLSDLSTGVTVEAVVRAVATDTPNHQGSKVYYSYATAGLLSGGKPALNLALANAPSASSARDRLEQSGWSVFMAESMASQQQGSQDLIDTCLRGAGILGLLVGGIGTANTMQVLLRRRRKEVAVWKTLGYREWHLQVMFAAEAGLLGAAGSLLGAGLGIAVSYHLVRLFSRTTNLLIAWSIAPETVAAGILVGTLTTVIFAMVAIVAAGQVQPQALLRAEALRAGGMPRRKTAVLLLLLAAPFTALTSLSMGSLLKGAAVLLFALLGLVVLGGMLGGAAWLLARLLPFQNLPLMRMARNSLRRRGLAQVFAMVALFAGVVPLSFGFVITQSAQREMDERDVAAQVEYNLAVIAPAAQLEAIQAEVSRLPFEKSSLGYKTAVRSIEGQMDGRPVAIQPLLVSRQDPHDYALSGAAWGSRPDGAYVFEHSGIPTGSQVTILLPGGAARSLEVVGRYSPDFFTSPTRDFGLLVPAGLSLEIAPPDTVQLFLRAPAGQAYSLADRVGAALPSAAVMNLLAYASRYIQVYRNLFVLAVSMAGLALLAGALLVANSVSLAMLDRRYEIGVLKTLGYSRRHILFTLVVEYLLVALVAGAAGLAVVKAWIWVTGLSNPLAARLIVLQPSSAALILLASLGLVLLSVLSVAWRPMQVSPAIVLNDRE